MVGGIRTAAWAAALGLALGAVPGAAAAGAVTGTGTGSGTVATPGSAGIGDPVFPGLGNGGYDVQAYALDLTYTAAGQLAGSVTMTARATQNLSRFDLDSYGLDITSVTVGGRHARFAQYGHELVVTPARPLRSGFDFVSVVRYSTSTRRVPQPRGGFVPTPDGFATAALPAGAHTIFPCNDHPSDKAPLTVRLTTPPGLTGVANGHLASTVTNPDLSVTTTFTTAEPVATELVQMSVGRYAVLEHGLRGATMLRDIAPTLRLPRVLPALSLTPGQLAWAQDRLGPFPLEAYGILVLDADAPGAFGPTGLATETLTLYKPGFLARPEQEIGPHMMRQLVHGWFGNSVTPRDYSSVWLAEGHAELYGLLYQFDRGWPDAEGNRTLEQHMRSLYEQADAWRRSSGPVARPTARTLLDRQRSAGGALALFALLEKIGPEAFTDLEQDFLAKFRDGTASTEDFIAQAEATTSDATMRRFLDAWLYGTRTPAMPTHRDWRVDPVSG